MGKNKTSFKPGQVANPKGRPKKGYSITEMMKELIASEVKDEKSGKMVKVREALGKSILKKALKGDRAAIRMIWNYMDGMPAQGVDITSKGEKIESLITYRPERKDE